MAYAVAAFACTRLSKIDLLAGGSSPVAPAGMSAAMRGQSAEPLSTASTASSAGRSLAIFPQSDWVCSCHDRCDVVRLRFSLHDVMLPSMLCFGDMTPHIWARLLVYGDHHICYTHHAKASYLTQYIKGPA